MKKLLIMAFAVLAVSAFAAEEKTEKESHAVESKRIEETHILENKDIANVRAQEVSLGESFMAAFGMSESSSATTNTANGSTATNAGVVNSNNSVTIITPYGKY